MSTKYSKNELFMLTCSCLSTHHLHSHTHEITYLPSKHPINTFYYVFVTPIIEIGDTLFLLELTTIYAIEYK